MRTRRVRLSGLTRYTRPIDLDVSDLPNGLVALTGTNGAGKSTILESMVPGALFRDLPTYGSLLSCATARDAYLDVEFDFGDHRWRAVHKLDAGTGTRSAPTGTSYLFRDDEEVTDGSGRTGVFDDVVARTFPRSAIWLASCFRMQDNAGDFATLPPAQRRDLFVDMLGLSALRDLATRASERRKVADRAYARLDGLAERIAEDRARAERLAVALADAEGLVAAPRQTVADLDVRHAQAQRRAAAARAAADQGNAGRVDALRRLDAARATERDALAAHDTARRRLDEALTLAAGVDLARARAEAAKTWSAAVAANGARVAAAVAAERATGEAHRSADDRLTTAARIVDGHERTVADAGDVANLEAAAVLCDQEAAGLDEAAQAAQDAATARRDAAAALTAAKASRAPALAAGRAAIANATRAKDDATTKAARLGSVPCRGGVVLVPEHPGDDESASVERDCGTCGLIADAVRARDAGAALLATEDAAFLAYAELEANDPIPALQSASTAADLAHVQAEGVVDAKRKAAARARDLRGKVDRARTARDALTTARATRDQYAAEVDVAVAAHNAASSELGAAREERDDLAARAIPGDHARDLARAEAAVASIPGLEADVGAASLAHTRAGEALDAVAVPEPDDQAEANARAAAAAVDELAGELTTARATLRSAEDQVAELRGQIVAGGDIDERATKLDAARLALATRRAGLRLAEQALGRNGVQALAIDGAAAQVGDTVTGLLRASFGGRFAVTLTTTRPKASGTGVVEVFDVLVHDGERPGGPRPLERTSHGERALIGCAFRLAVAAVNARRTGAPFRTLYLDEADAGLDHDNRSRYPAIVRAAMTAGGFDRAIMITHEDRIIAQADAVIFADGGDVRVLRSDG